MADRRSKRLCKLSYAVSELGKILNVGRSDVKIKQRGKTEALAIVAALIVCVAFASFVVVSYQLDWAGADSGRQTSDTTAESVQVGKEELVAYALSLINSDRQASNAPNVTLSPVASAQKHAEDMLKNSFFSHWNIEGYKPYVRYTLAGGRGAVNENIAAQFGSSLDPKAAIRDLEWSMMHDDAESDWGHRNNILDAFHNRVSIGIAYDNDSFYLVQDFEDAYVEWTTLSSSNSAAILAGKFTSSDLTIRQVDIYFDDWLNLTTNYLEDAPYNGSYNSGKFVGSVAGFELVLTEGIFSPARDWSQSGQSFQISFGLDTFFSRFGKGIYTLRLFSDSGECLTDFSIFNSD